MAATTVIWQDGMSFATQTRSAHTVLMDSSASVGGQNKGPRPTEMVLSGLGGCTGMDVASILRKMRQSWERFEIAIEADARDEHPRVFTAIRVVYRIWGAVDHAKFKRAVQLSVEQYCPVAAMLRASGAAITYTCEVNGAPAA